MNSPQTHLPKKEVLLMNMITQEARKKQDIVKQAIKNGKSYTSRKYGVSLSTLKRWCKKYKIGATVDGSEERRQLFLCERCLEN